MTAEGKQKRGCFASVFLAVFKLVMVLGGLYLLLVLVVFGIYYLTDEGVDLTGFEAYRAQWPVFVEAYERSEVLAAQGDANNPFPKQRFIQSP